MNIDKEELDASILDAKRSEEATRIHDRLDRTFNQLEHLCYQGAKMSLGLKGEDRRILNGLLADAQKATAGGPFGDPERVAEADDALYAVLASIDPGIRENRYLMW